MPHRAGPPHERPATGVTKSAASARRAAGATQRAAGVTQSADSVTKSVAGVRQAAGATQSAASVNKSVAGVRRTAGMRLLRIPARRRPQDCRGRFGRLRLYCRSRRVADT